MGASSVYLRDRKTYATYPASCLGAAARLRTTRTHKCMTIGHVHENVRLGSRPRRHPSLVSLRSAARTTVCASGRTVASTTPALRTQTSVPALRGGLSPLNYAGVLFPEHTPEAIRRIPSPPSLSVRRESHLGRERTGSKCHGGTLDIIAREPALMQQRAWSGFCPSRRCATWPVRTGHGPRAGLVDGSGSTRDARMFDCDIKRPA